MRCQSCGVLIMHANEFGTTSTGAKNLDYCRYCYEMGEYVEPELTLDQMVDKLSEQVKAGKRGVTDEQARQTVRETLIGLKRWRHLQGPGQVEKKTE